jgi:hypothetical protein
VGSSQASQLQSSGWVLGAPQDATIVMADQALKNIGTPVASPAVQETPVAPPVPTSPTAPTSPTPPQAPTAPTAPPVAPQTQQATLTSPDGKSKTVVNVGSSEASQLQTRGWKLDASGQAVLSVQDALNFNPSAPTDLSGGNDGTFMDGTGDETTDFNLDESGDFNLNDFTTDPVNQSILEKYGITAPKVSDNPVTSYADTYKQLLGTMGITNIKSEFEKTQQKFTDLQTELNDKISEVNDDPWLTEGVRVGRIRSLQDKYEGRLQILTDQQKLYQSMYEQGVQEAQFVANAAFNQQQFDAQQSFNMAQLALQEQEARDNLRSTNLRDQLAIAQEMRQAASDRSANTEASIENARLNLKMIADMFGADVFKNMSASEKQKWEKDANLPLGTLDNQVLTTSELDTSVQEVNGRKVLINNQTGDVIRDLGMADGTGGGGKIVTINGVDYIQNPDGTLTEPVLPGGGINQQELEAANEKVALIDSLLNSKGLSGAVGTYGISRWTPFTADKGARQEFAAGVNQLISQETLDNLIAVKAQGATFGALSETELDILKQSASKIGTWMQRDKNGNPTGKFEVSEEAFKKELNRMKEATSKIIEYARIEQTGGADITSEELKRLKQVFPGMSEEEIRQELSFSSGTGGTPTASIQLGSRLARVNNNPGNLRYVGQAGASQGEGGIARFPTPEAGYQALISQIQLDASRGLTLEEFINKYAPPIENDTSLYLRQMVSAVGASPTTPLKNINLDTLARAMAKKESSTIIT